MIFFVTYCVQCQAIFYFFKLTICLIFFSCSPLTKQKQIKRLPLLDSISETYPIFNEADSTQLIKYKGFHLSYDESSEQALWVSYILTKEMLQHSNVNRTNDFREDTMVITYSAALSDYKKSGYDRGHLVPAADMKWSGQTMSESFLLSNMSPQKPKFNRGIWKKLEGKVRKWAMRDEMICISTGPLFIEVIDTIGENEVLVPSHYFKVIMDVFPPEYKGIAFIMENKQSNKPLLDHAVSIDSLEKLMDANFIEQVPDDIEYLVESKLDIYKWK